MNVPATPPRPLDILSVFPELADHARTGVRLHPEPAHPGLYDSSIGGPLAWPADELNRHGDGAGIGYRSAVFYVGKEQRRIATATIADVSAAARGPGRGSWSRSPAGSTFCGQAEPEHHNYLKCCSDAHTCHYAPTLGVVRRVVHFRRMKSDPLRDLVIRLAPWESGGRGDRRGGLGRDPAAPPV